tara:strand:- start:177 stop:491 length:315 start_codon:yes stop_codon:yes gene_type:complete
MQDMNFQIQRHLVLDAPLENIDQIRLQSLTMIHTPSQLDMGVSWMDLEGLVETHAMNARIVQVVTTRMKLQNLNANNVQTTPHSHFSAEIANYHVNVTRDTVTL